jgi:hypothetical protein
MSAISGAKKINEGKFIRHAAEAVDRWTDKELAARERHHFGGKPGTPVPEVDPEDLKAVWDYSAETRKGKGPNGAISIRFFERLCKPGADVQAICYRSSMIGLLATFLQPQQLTPNEAGTLDMKVFKAAAKMPLEWMGEGVRKELPFDVEKFLQRCA